MFYYIRTYSELQYIKNLFFQFSILCIKKIMHYMVSKRQTILLNAIYHKHQYSFYQVRLKITIHKYKLFRNPSIALGFLYKIKHRTLNAKCGVNSFQKNYLSYYRHEFCFFFFSNANYFIHIFYFVSIFFRCRD